MAEDERKRVLIVEDEPATADLFGLILQIHGYEFQKTYGTRQAIEAMNRYEPDAVILDVMMPDLSGLEFCRYVRRDPRLEHIPIIIVSAKSFPEDVEEGMAAGATAYLPKPVTQESLIRALSDALAT
ncbi:MAG: response regulator [Chloroflexi bacterium]|nr:response regulator [Chloroflexota bacterium]